MNQKKYIKINNENIAYYPDELIEYPGTNDFVFKRIMKRKDICAEIINLVTEDDLKQEDIVYFDSEIGVQVNSKKVICDVLLYSDSSVYDLEMQNGKVQFGLLERFVRYAIQIGASTVGKGKSYGEIKNVSIIVFYNGTIDYDKFIYIFPETTIDLIKFGKSPIKLYFLILENLEKCSNIKLKNFIKILVSKNPQSITGVDELMEEVKKEIMYFNKSEAEAIINARNEAKEYCDEMERKIREEERKKLEKALEDKQKALDEKNLQIEAERIKSIKKFNQLGLSSKEIANMYDLTIEEVKEIIKS